MRVKIKPEPEAPQPTKETPDREDGAKPGEKVVGSGKPAKNEIPGNATVMYAQRGMKSYPAHAMPVTDFNEAMEELAKLPQTKKELTAEDNARVDELTKDPKRLEKFLFAHCRKVMGTTELNCNEQELATWVKSAIETNPNVRPASILLLHLMTWGPAANLDIRKILPVDQQLVLFYALYKKVNDVIRQPEERDEAQEAEAGGTNEVNKTLKE